VPLAKLQWSHLAQTLAELAVDLLGPAGMMAKGSDFAADGGAWNRLYVFQRYTSIGAGTTEVQKNIIADRALKLPKR
jgi:alkylation response protein AidB-like acyl-CoA dehydrogenase